MAGVFAVTGLLLLALHLARPDALRGLVQTDARLWSFLPWADSDWLDPESKYQRMYRRFAVAALTAWILVNLGLFVLSYTPLM